MDKLLDYEGLIYSIINKYPKRFERDDLYQVGMLGLIDAYKHFDSSQGTKFSTYAYYYIIGEVNKYIRESSSLKVSKNLIELKKSIIKAKEVISQRLGREATNTEVAVYLEVTPEMVDMALQATDEMESIDDVYNVVKTYDDTSPELLDLRNEIMNLPSEERNLILARYYEELTQRETSSILGMSQVQVSRCEAKILQKLRDRL
ncbi:MAG: sigma-70 family RNA polymerase sigma factor [Bacilli bacterium]|nr:sigma-70 family RNA polymerase sigma factor [Bacilli bacterium]